MEEGDGVTGSAFRLHRRVMEDVLKTVRTDWLSEGVDPLLPDRLRARWLEKMEARNEVKSEGAVGQAALELLQGGDAPPPPLPPDAPRPVKREAEAADAPGAAPEKKAKVAEKESGEESLSSLSDDSDVIHEEGESDTLILCQFETVKKTKNTWKVKLRYGLIATETQDYRFAVANAVLTRW